MKNAFTMIELIFVIVILGVLAAISIPKFIGVAETADETTCKAFVGTLNRTVSHSIWASSILDNPHDYNVTTAKLQENVDEQNKCGTLVEFADATSGTPFTIHIGDNDYNISAKAANGTGPAQWVMSKL